MSQAVYDPAPTIRLLRDYGDACRKEGLQPCKVVLTFAPCGRPKTMTFLKWLGIRVPEEAERRILDAESPVDESVALLCETLTSPTAGGPLAILGSSGPADRVSVVASSLHRPHRASASRGHEGARRLDSAADASRSSVPPFVT